MTTDLDDPAALRSTIERALRDALPAGDPGPAAIAAGRRIRQRRRGGLAAASFAAVAAVGALAVPLVGGSTDAADRDHRGFATDGPSADPAPSPPGETPSPGPSDVPFPGYEAPAGWWDMPAAQMLAELEARLPAGVTVADPNPPAEGGSRAPGYLNLLLEGPSGTGRFAIMLRPRQTEETPEPVTWTDKDGNEHTAVMAEATPYGENIRCRDAYLACEILRDGSGGKVGDVSTEQDGGTTYHNADLLGPDGGAINLYVADSTGQKPGYERPTADTPPLTFDQVRELVQDPVWTSYRP